MDKILQYYLGNDPLIAAKIIDSLQMLFAYGFVCVLLASFFLKSFVKDKSFAYRIIFYQVVSNIYINVVGFILAYLNLFNMTMIWLFLLILPLSIKLVLYRELIKAKLKITYQIIYEVLLKIYSVKILRRNIRRRIVGGGVSFYQEYIKGFRFETLSVLFVLTSCFMFFGRLKFSLEGFQYAASDEEVHLYWISSMLQGNSFPSGLYPHGLHFLTGALVEFFGLDLIEGYLAFGPALTVIIFANLYFILRDLFKTKYSIVLAMSVFLIADILHTATAYYRFQLAIPMEFGSVAIFATFFALIYYIRKPEKKSWWLFVLSIVWSMFVHFYDTIFIAFLCIPFGIIFLKQMVQKKILKKIIAGGLLAILLSIVPFGVGYAIGHPFEQSMAWALSIMTADSQNESTQAEVVEVETEEESFGEKLSLSFERYSTSYMFSDNLVTIIIFSLCTCMFVVGLLGALIKKFNSQRSLLYLTFSSFWFMISFVMFFETLGLPVIIASSRCATLLGLLTVPVLMFPVMLVEDFMNLIWADSKKRAQMAVTAVIAWTGIGAILGSGYIKTVQYYSSTLTETDGKIAEYLVRTQEPDTWTLITSTNSISLILGNGFHYEIIDLLEHIYDDEGELYIPTPSIYVTVEKDAKGWVYPTFADLVDRKLESVPVSVEHALKDDVFSNNDLSQRSRAYVEYRPEIMSKLYYWAEKIEETYPDETSIVFEDDEARIYKIEQDPYFLLNLSVDYMSELEE